MNQKGEKEDGQMPNENALDTLGGALCYAIDTVFDALIRTHWKGHNSLVGFAMDHGCHEIDGNCGSHGLDMEEDLNIVHSYQIYPAE